MTAVPWTPTIYSPKSGFDGSSLGSRNRPKMLSPRAHVVTMPSASTAASRPYIVQCVALATVCSAPLSAAGKRRPSVARQIIRASSTTKRIIPRTIWVERTATRGVPLGNTRYGRVDSHVPIGGLGRHLRPNWESFPRREFGYLVADSTRTMALRERLRSPGDHRKVIGISWKSKHPRFELEKSARLQDFEHLLRTPDFRFVDLQYGETSADRLSVEADCGVRVEHFDDIDNTNDIDGLAALISACDAVITVSNTTAHLAGALGRPTWVFLPLGHARWWYWFKEGDDCPWYPKLKLMRQARGQSWKQLIAAHVDMICAGLRN